ncbi:hypothetical protein JXA80_01685, partial [bacterium]|nr:hypothetical protein [candidate division CSSED10-310 bacterium]
MKKPSVLITGFGPFPGHPDNVSQHVLNYIAGCGNRDLDITTLLLPVSFAAVAQNASTLVASGRFDVIIATGVNARLHRIALEKRALNRAHTRIPDTDNAMPWNEPLLSGQALSLDTRVDLEKLSQWLNARSIGCDVSLFAGRYVCNALYYHLLRNLEPSTVPCILLHLPPDSSPNSVHHSGENILQIARHLTIDQDLPDIDEIETVTESINTQDDAERFLYGFINLEKQTGLAYTEDNYNLSRFTEFLEQTGYPRPGDGQVVHVAGTKGKGAVCALIASILSAHGHRVGLYTSPHLVNIRERIRLDGQAIPQQDFVDEVRFLREVITRRKLTLNRRYRTTFELLTALAFRYFSRTRPDWVVLETGMGGRLDCTNVLLPVVSVVTRIDRDHTDSLGNTLNAIAREKAGIIKPKVPVVTGRQLPMIGGLLRRIAIERDAPYQTASR